MIVPLRNQRHEGQHSAYHISAEHMRDLRRTETKNTLQARPLQILIGTLRQNCYSPRKNFDTVKQIVTLATNFLAQWEKIVIHLTKFSIL